MKKTRFFVIIIFLFPLISRGQHSRNYGCYNNFNDGSLLGSNIGTPLVLRDFGLKIDFVLDCTHTLISAYNYNGILLWNTDPWKDNSIEVYGTYRPFIVYLSFGTIESNRWNYNRLYNANFPSQIYSEIRVLKISYNNTQFGYINLENGKFLFAGQD